jgi:hypothetical protein
VNTALKLSLLLVAIGWPIVGQAQSYSEMTSMWTAKNYDNVLPLLLEYRKKPLGRKWQVDYMIGTSQCHGSKHLSRGAEYLSNVLVYKQVPDSVRSAVTREVKFCLEAGEGIEEHPSFDMVPVSGQVVDPATVSGKGGYNFLSSRSIITTGRSELSPVPIADLMGRVKQRGQEREALNAAKHRLEGDVKGLVVDGFVVVCKNCYFPLTEVPKCLKRFKGPMQEEFDIVSPDQLVTVYIPEGLEDLPRYAQVLHGISLPLGTLAYSVLEDLSIVGIYEGGCGTLAHELMHLAIRSNFGDSPAWLEEGLASEIAVGAPEPQKFRFWQSWRDSVLRQHWDLRPTVAQLMAMNWSDFAARDRASLDRVAAIHAMSAVFVRYLDDKQKLRPIYFAIRDERFPSESEASGSDASIVEKRMGMNLTEIDADFSKWFEKERP